jgi:hypothetical protein
VLSREMELEAEGASSALSESEALEEERELMLRERADRQKHREDVAEKKHRDVRIAPNVQK